MTQTERILHFAAQCSEEMPTVDELYVSINETFPSEASVTALQKDAFGNVTKACRLAPVATRITVEGPVVIDPIARDTFRISLLTGRILVTDYRFGEIWAKAVEDNRQKREASGT